jgi:hypothetical protein
MIGRLVLLPVRLALVLLALLTVLLMVQRAVTPDIALAAVEGGWTARFIAAHTPLTWIVLLATIASVAVTLRRSGVRVLTVPFVIAAGAAAVWLYLRPVGAAGADDRVMLGTAVLALVAVLWVAAIDLASARGTLHWFDAGTGEDRRLLRALFSAALFIAVLYAALTYLRGVVPAAVAPREWWLSAIWSVAAHLVAFAAAFLVLALVRGVARFAGRPSRVEFIAGLALLAAATTVWIARVALAELTTPAELALAIGAACGVAIAVALAGIAVRLRSTEGGFIESGFELLLSPFNAGPKSPRAVAVLGLVAAALLAYAASTRTLASVAPQRIDLVRELTATVVWMIALAGWYGVMPRPARKRDTVVGLMACAAGVLAAYAGLEIFAPQVTRQAGLPDVDVSEMLDRYSAFDSSFTLARRILR